MLISVIACETTIFVAAIDPIAQIVLTNEVVSHVNLCVNDLRHYVNLRTLMWRSPSYLGSS